MFFPEPCGWGVVGEVLSGPGVELPHHVVDVPGAVDGQVGALGEILADESVEVLVGATLPGAGAFGEEHRNTGRLREYLMAGHFRYLVPGQGAFQGRRQQGERAGDGGIDACRSVVLRQIDDDSVLGFSFSQGHHR